MKNVKAKMSSKLDLSYWGVGFPKNEKFKAYQEEMHINIISSLRENLRFEQKYNYQHQNDKEGSVVLGLTGET